MNSKDLPIDFSLIIASSVHDMKNSLSMLLHSLDEVSHEVAALELPISGKMATLQYEAARVNNDLVQLLSLYKLENQTLKARIDEHHIQDFLEEQVARYTPLFRVKEVNCEVQCEEDLVGYFDRDLISGVINNTLANAIRYCKGELRVSARGQDGGLVISIDDNGQGFTQAMIDQPGRSLSSVDFSTGNTHLGLYFAQRIAELHTQAGLEGYIRLHNEGQLGGGCFELFLP